VLRVYYLVVYRVLKKAKEVKRKELAKMHIPTLTPMDVAKRLGVHRESVYRWLRKGELKAYRIGWRWKVSEYDLSLFIHYEHRGDDSGEQEL